MSQEDDNFIRRNVLSVLDVAGMLSVSKQYVAKLIKEGKIRPARTEHPILFSRSEIEKYLDDLAQAEFFWSEPDEVVIPEGKQTYFFPKREHQNQCFADLVAYLPYLEGISEIWIFQSEEEAAWAGFYRRGQEIVSGFFGYEAPSMIITGKNGNQLWLKAFICGADNGGSRATQRVLRLLISNGYIGNLLNLERNIFGSPAIHIYQNMNAWELQGELSGKMVSDARKRILWEKRGIKTVADDHRLLLLIPDMEGTRTPNEKVELLRVYDVYIKEPGLLSLHQTPEDAHANGTYAPDLHGRLTTYQVVITCLTENGIWFQSADPGEGVGIGKSPDILAILEYYNCLSIPKSFLEMRSTVVPLPSFIDFYEQENGRIVGAKITNLPKK